MERKTLVVIFSGLDRPGIVDALSECISAHGGNWEESRMARLSDRFAGILEITVPVSSQGALSTALNGINSESLHVRVEHGGAPGERLQRRSLHLELTGADHPGIVSDVSRVLASGVFNIEELHTATTSAPMSGETLFTASADISCEEAADVDALLDALEALADDLVVDISLNAR